MDEGLIDRLPIPGGGDTLRENVSVTEAVPEPLALTVTVSPETISALVLAVMVMLPMFPVPG
jgi:hypothetical protein